VRLRWRLAIALLLVAFTGFEGIKHTAYLWVVVGLAIPELSLLSRVRWRGVRSYWAALAVLAAGLPDPMPLAVFIVGLAWATRIATERAVDLAKQTRKRLRRAG
jgi:hypothetical protein